MKWQGLGRSAAPGSGLAMAAVAAVYTVAPFARTAEQVVRGLAGAGLGRSGRSEAALSAEQAGLGKPGDARGRGVEQAFAEAESRDLDHRKTWVALVDGNAEQLQTLHLLATAWGLNLRTILDLIHMCEYLWKASLCSPAAIRCRRSCRHRRASSFARPSCSGKATRSSCSGSLMSAALRLRCVTSRLGRASGTRSSIDLLPHHAQLARPGTS